MIVQRRGTDTRLGVQRTYLCRAVKAGEPTEALTEFAECGLTTEAAVRAARAPAH